MVGGQGRGAAGWPVGRGAVVGLGRAGARGYRLGSGTAGEWWEGRGKGLQGGQGGGEWWEGRREGLQAGQWPGVE